jgi:outer membrane protein W
MSRRISSIALGAGVLLLAAGVFAEPARGPVEKRRDLERDTDGQNAKKPKPKKGADADEAAEEEDAPAKKSKAKGKKAKKDADEPADEADEKPKKKGKKAKKEEAEEQPEKKEEPKKKGKGKKGKKEEPPPEEEPVDLKDTEAPTATPEETPEEPPAEETPAEPPPKDESAESEKAEASASASTADAAGKLFLGLRLGFGLPMGDTTGDEVPVKFSNKIPIWIDLGYKFTPSLMVGLYGQYAFAGIDQCFSNAECSAHVMRFGVQAQYEFSPQAKFDPWLGLGIGYEIAGGTISVAEQGEASFELKGFEFVNLQAGADFKVAPSVGIGPFVSFSVGRYASGEVSDGGATRSGGITHKTMHEWLVLGIRGAFTL